MNLETHNLLQISQELHTIRDFIRWAYSRFNEAHLYYGHGTDNAWDEAINIVLSSLHLPPDASPDLLNARLTQVESREVCDFIMRRIEERIPVAYLIKEAWFAGLPFYVDERVIIPRSPIAELIENHFSPWLANDQPVDRILDLCTGCGCIAIACAIAFPDSEVDAVDISEAALDVSKINLRNHHLEHQVRLIQSDLFKNVHEQYDLIVSNPPYVSEEEYQALPKEYHHEPELALKATDEGLAVVKRILLGALKHLNENGLLIVEVGNSQEALNQRYPEVSFLWLEFERGGEGVFALTKEQLQRYQHTFKDN